jgi:alanyl-tRNA synthetase
MTAQEIRKAYLDFFVERGHKVIPRAQLVPQEDPTTLFTGSGMQPLIPYLLGERHPEGRRLVDSQTCLRAEDMDEVGDNRHTKQLAWFFEFLTKAVGLDPNKLYVTVFAGDKKNNLPQDEESAKIWQQLFGAENIEAKTAEIGSEQAGYERGIEDGERIFYYDAGKNWWSREGVPDNMQLGEPGGPDSEVFYDFGTKHDSRYGKNCHPNCEQRFHDLQKRGVRF